MFLLDSISVPFGRFKAKYIPSPSSKLVFLALLLSAWGGTLTTSAIAQDTVTGAFEGIVTNSQTGASISRANVQIINQHTGLIIPQTSDSRGRFYQGLLPPGIYTIRVSAPGFQTKEVQQRLFITRTGEVVPVPVSLDPVSAISAQPATVATPASPAAAPSASPKTTLTAEDTDIRARINAADASLGGAFTEEDVATLPLGGATFTRTFDELALLLPGVAPPPQTLGSVAGPGVGAGVGTAGQFAVNGLRSRANNFTVDGSDNNDEDIGVRRQGFVALNSQPIESVKEYQAITLLAPAQFGRNIGAQVNVVSKSGGASTHGAVYGLFNSSQLNGRNYFDTSFGNATTALMAGNQNVVRDSTFGSDSSLGLMRIRFLPPLNSTPLMVRNQSEGEDSFTFWQGGLVLGGPLEDARGPNDPPRMFYFIAAEGYVTNARKEESFAVPTVSQRGVFGTGASSNFALTNFSGSPSDRFTFPVSSSGNAVFSLFPFPNNPAGVYGPNTFTQALPASSQGKVASARFDRNFQLRGNRQSFTARYNFTQDWRDIPATGGALFSTLRPRARTQNLSLFLNSEVRGGKSDRTLFNQVRLSYGRTRLNFEDVPDREFLLPSAFSDPKFGSFGLINAPLLENFTSPGVNASRMFVANPVDVFYLAASSNIGRCGLAAGQADRACTTEDRLGPIGQVNVAGFSPVGIDVFNFPQRRVNNTYQLADTLSWGAGNHRFTFGADTRRTELNSDLPRNARTLLTFNGVLPASFRLPLSASQMSLLMSNRLFTFPTDRAIRPEDLVAAGAASGDYLTLGVPGSSNLNLRFYQFNFFGQDAWRVRPNLTLSYGLRYEYNTPPREARRRIEDTFSSPELSLVPGLKSFIDGRTRIFEPDHNNFGPRVGLAYTANLFGRRTEPTIFRAGYGLFYDQILGAVVSQSRNVFPTFLTANLAGGSGNFNFGSVNGTLSICNPVVTPFSNPCSNIALVASGINTPNPTRTTAELITLVNCFARGGGPTCGRPELLPGVNGAGATLPARQLATPFAHHYSFSVEQQLGPDLAISIAYVGTLGRHLLRFNTPNLGPNTYLTLQALTISSGFPQPGFFGFALPPGTGVTAAGGFTGGRPNSGVGSVNIFETTANSRYNALQLQVRGRLTGALRYQLGYTLAKAVDDVSDVFDLAGASALPQNSLNLKNERGPANFDLRHHLAYNFVCDFRISTERGRLFRALLGGFQLTSFGSFQTGQPFTVNSIFDVNLDGNLTDRLNITEGLVRTGDRRQPLRLTVDPIALLAPVGQDGQVGRNTFRAGSVLDLNAALLKNFRLGGQQSLSLRMDVFNFINRANYGIPVRFLEAPGFGQATSTVTPARRIQFALKYSF